MREATGSAQQAGCNEHISHSRSTRQLPLQKPAHEHTLVRIQELLCLGRRKLEMISAVVHVGDLTVQWNHECSPLAIVRLVTDTEVTVPVFRGTVPV